jgi:hypothetical protein
MKTLHCILLLGMSGCALLQPGAERAVMADGITAEAVNVSRAPAAEQKAALARAQEAVTKDSSALNRLRLATLLATLPAPLRDDARAAELLEGLADASSPGAGRLAALLGTQIVERQRLAREVDRLAKEADRLGRERTRTEAERDKREEALRQQLEALRSIERGILEREEKLRGGRGKP